MKPTFTANDGTKIQIDFTVKGYSYSKKKRSALQIGDVVKTTLETYTFPAEQEWVMKHIMENIGDRFGLITVFRNMGIVNPKWNRG